jgi:hypothetical protein
MDIIEKHCPSISLLFSQTLFLATCPSGGLFPESPDSTLPTLISSLCIKLKHHAVRLTLPREDPLAELQN